MVKVAHFPIKLLDDLYNCSYTYNLLNVVKKNINKKKPIMKKVLAILSIVALTSCGGSVSTEVSSDSSAVVVDSTKVDSLTVVDSVESKVEEVK